MDGLGFLDGLCEPRSDFDADAHRARMEAKRERAARARLLETAAKDSAARWRPEPAARTPRRPAPKPASSREQSARLYVEGRTPQEVAAERHLPLGTVLSHLRASGMAQAEEAEVIARVVARVAVGEHVAQIARTEGLSVAAVRRAAADAGVERPQPPRTERSVTPRHDPAETRRLHEEGLTVAEIAARTGASTATVRNHLRGAGLRPNRAPRHVSDTSVVELYTSGLGQVAVARRLGLAPSTVNRILVAAGVPRRKRGHRITKPTGSAPKVYPSELVERVRELAARGLSQSEIADALSTTRKVVWRVMDRHQIPALAQKAREGADGARALKDTMARHQVTTAQVRAWAELVGEPMAARGLPSAAVLDAYLAAGAPAGDVGHVP